MNARYARQSSLRSETHLTVPILLISAFVASSHGVETNTNTSLFFNLIAVDLPPMGKTPNLENGMEKMVMDGERARMTRSVVADMVCV
jgi:hypothetical protein